MFSSAVLERLGLPAPVDRIPFVQERCRGRAVLDLGCLDETALFKQGTGIWLHSEIAAVARSVLGIDSSDKVPPEGIATAPNSRIIRGDAVDPAVDLAANPIDVIVAGELIEHLPNPAAFLGNLKRRFPGKELICTTPNATALTNVILGVAGCESSHPDHLLVLSVRTIGNLCRRVGFARWSIVPYYARYVEITHTWKGVQGLVARAVERSVNVVERFFPMLAGGLILHVEEI